MSKRSLFWGQAAGKLGEAVYYRAGGEQRARTYVGKIKNPKTFAQMVNRIPMANLVAVYRALRPWMVGAFENKPARRSDFNEFFALNKNRLSYVQTRGDAALGLFVPNGLKLSRGTLPLSPKVEFSQKEDNYVPQILGLLPGTVGISQLSAIGVTQDSALTGDSLYKLMTANGNPNQLPARFKVTFVVFGYGLELPDNADGEAWTSGVISVDCYEGNTAQVFPVGKLAQFINSVRVYGDVTGGNIISASAITLSLSTSLTATYSGLQMACIVSYTQNGKQFVTTSEVVPSNEAIRLARPIKRGGAAWQAALNEYGYTPDSALSTSALVETPAVEEPEEPAPDDEGPAD